MEAGDIPRNWPSLRRGDLVLLVPSFAAEVDSHAWFGVGGYSSVEPRVLAEVRVDFEHATRQIKSLSKYGTEFLSVPILSVLILASFIVDI